MEAELARCGNYLGGEQADSWDIHVWGMVWMIHSALPDLVPIVEGYSGVVAWYERMVALGTGARTDAEIAVAWESLNAAEPRALPATAADEPLKARLGQSVQISAGSADRGGARGRLLAIDHEQVVLAVTPIEGVDAQVWFPRFGYHLSLDS